MNSVNIDGRLTRDPEYGMSHTGKPVCKFSIACNRTKEYTDFFDVVAFDKSADNVRHYFNKGDGICITGRLSQERWQDKQSGAKRSHVSVICDRWSFPLSRAEHKADPQSPANDGGFQVPDEAPAPVGQEDVPF